MNTEQPAGGVRGSAATGGTAAPLDERARPKRRPALLYRFPKLFLHRPVMRTGPVSGRWCGRRTPAITGNCPAT